MMLQQLDQYQGAAPRGQIAQLTALKQFLGYLSLLVMPLNLLTLAVLSIGEAITGSNSQRPAHGRSGAPAFWRPDRDGRRQLPDKRARQCAITSGWSGQWG
jgi:hypothetical protein